MPGELLDGMRRKIHGTRVPGMPEDFRSPVSLACHDVCLSSDDAASGGEAHAGHLTQRLDESPPVGTLLGQHFPSRFGDPVVAPPALAGFLDPSPLDPPALLHAIERGVERGQREAEIATGSLLDQLRNLVAVMPVVFDDRENEDFGAALLGFVYGPAIRHDGSLYEGELYVMSFDGETAGRVGCANELLKSVGTATGALSALLVALGAPPPSAAKKPRNG